MHHRKNPQLGNPHRGRATAVAAGLTAAVMSVTAVTAQADEAQPGTTDAAHPAATDTAQPGTTDAARPAPREVQYTPMADTAPVPAPVQNYAPQISQAAQPLQREPEVIYIENEPIVITETEYIDRAVVEESGGLFILTDEGRQWVTADKIIAAATENYQGRDQADKDKLNLAAAAATLGATGGFLLGAGLGTIAGGAGLASAAFATTSIPVVITAPVPIVGQVTATGATAAAIAAGIAGAGGGFVLGGALGSAVGADAAMNASGQKPAVQEFLADIVFTLENGAREDAGYRGLVGDKPSGLPGYREVDEGGETRITDGTILGEGTDRGRHASGQESSFESLGIPRHALPEVPDLGTPQEMVTDAVEQAQQNVSNATEQAQEFAADPQQAATDAVEQAQQNVSNFVDQANLPSLPI